MKLVAISDTHNQHKDFVTPYGDVLIHAGDATYDGTIQELADFAKWFCSQPHPYKIFVPGNHDFLCQYNTTLARSLFIENNVYFLLDEAITIEGIHFYGSPWQPTFGNMAFNLNDKDIVSMWDKIPLETDVLITHGPPNGILDRVQRDFSHVGCKSLRKAVQRILPLVHIFGHIHEAYGTMKYDGDIKYVNASICNLKYKPVNSPVIIEI